MFQPSSSNLLILFGLQVETLVETVSVKRDIRLKTLGVSVYVYLVEASESCLALDSWCLR